MDFSSDAGQFVFFVLPLWQIDSLDMGVDEEMKEGNVKSEWLSGLDCSDGITKLVIKKKRGKLTVDEILEHLGKRYDGCQFFLQLHGNGNCEPQWDEEDPVGDRVELIEGDRMLEVLPCYGVEVE